MGLLDNITHKEYYQGNNLGNYQFTSLDHIISQFEIAYVGENKIIPKANRADIAFHAQRALQELSFDTFKSIKAQQIDLPPTLVMPLPHDYVNYTKISQVDSAGIKRLLYPVKETSNPFQIRQLDNGTYNFPSGESVVKNSGFDDLDGDSKNYQRCFVAADYVRNEMIAAYPSTSGVSGGPANKAIIWNWKTNTFSMRDLPTASHITSGIVQITAGTTWNNITGTWNSGSGAWGSTNYANVSENLVFADVTNTKLFRDNSGNTKDGANMTSYIERSGYDLGDPSMVKYVRAVYPELEVSGDNKIKVYLGHQMATEQAITWDNGTEFNPNTQSKVSCTATGKYFAIKFESTGDFDWKLNGLAFDVSERGKRGSRSY